MLKLSSDRKVAQAFTPAGNVRVRNAFGLPAGVSCPGMTDACEAVCYAKRGERYTGVRNLVTHNYDALINADGVDGMADLLAGLIADFLAEHERKGEGDPIFRIHWDGDFYSVDYARAWARVIRANPDVKFWAYTRSFRGDVNVVPVLAGIDNLALYLSVDDDNRPDAGAVLAAYPDVRVAYLASTMREALPVVRDLTGKPGAMCPELVSALPLNGACASCGICVDGTASVRFASTKGARAKVVG